jgi:hypothetical protein
MWLLNTTTLSLQEFFGASIPRYAILSHTWGQDELLFQDIHPHASLTSYQKLGHQKVTAFCALAQKEGYEWGWVDSCCIDKRSSAELTEAINSMYTWYLNGEVCFIHLEDVRGLGEISRKFKADKWLDMFRNSRWFKRGWTLQELIASKRRVWLSKDWKEIDPKDFKARHPMGLLNFVSTITDINAAVLENNTQLPDHCIAERMSWASRREVTRPEDGAYSLMGLFGVNMPVLYGEGIERAFARLQDEIMKGSFDQTIFAWRGPYGSSGLLARTPKDFSDTPLIQIWGPDMLAPFNMTNTGLYIRAYVVREDEEAGFVQVALQCDLRTREGWANLLIRLKKVEDARACWVNGVQCEVYRRVECEEWEKVPCPGEPGHYRDLLVLEDKHYSMIRLSLTLHQQRWREIQRWGDITPRASDREDSQRPMKRGGSHNSLRKESSQQSMRRSGGASHLGPWSNPNFIRVSPRPENRGLTPSEGSPHHQQRERGTRPFQTAGSHQSAQQANSEISSQGDIGLRKIGHEHGRRTSQLEGSEQSSTLGGSRSTISREDSWQSSLLEASITSSQMGDSEGTLSRSGSWRVLKRSRDWDGE